jgi:homocysteine S-methyltransferase
MAGYPAYYMINCAHPLHLDGTLAEAGLWRDRVYGVRANASTRSHAELDAMTELDAGDRSPAHPGHLRHLRVLKQRAVHHSSVWR